MTDPNRPLWYLTSDPHLFHALPAVERGFGTTEKPDLEGHALWFKDRCTEIIRPCDKLLIAGDLTGGGAEPIERALELLDELPFEKHFVSGNHDPVHPSNPKATKVQRRWLQTFHSVSPFLLLALGEGNRQRRVAVSHFPIFGDAEHSVKERFPEWRLKPHDRWHLHGHTHNKNQHVHDGKQIHIGIDAWGSPVSEETILRLIENEESRSL